MSRNFPGVGPIVVARGLVASFVPHSLLDFGDGVAPQRLGLGGNRVLYPEKFAVFFGQVLPQVTLITIVTWGSPPLLLPRLGAWGLLSEPRLLLLLLP